VRDRAAQSDGRASRVAALSTGPAALSCLGRPREFLLAALLLVLSLLAVGDAPVNAERVPSTGGSSSLIALTPDGATLLVVNPDSNTVTFVDAASSAVLVELVVGVDPRSVALSPDGATAFVANQGSDSLAVVDVPSKDLATELPIGDRPVGTAVSRDGRFVAVAELGDDAVRLLDGASWTTTAVLPVSDRPHGLGFTPDGRRLLVTHLLSGEVTILTIEPFRIFLPLIIKVPAAGPTRVLADGPGMAIGATRLASIFTWDNVAPAPSVIVNEGGTRAYLPQTMANGLGLNTDFDTSVFPKVSVLNLETSAHQPGEHISLPETDRPVGLPWGAALARDDTELWVVNAGSNDVSVIDIGDPTRPRRRAHIPVGHSPRGVVVSNDGSRAYVNNVLAGTVSVISTDTYSVTETITVTDIPLPPALLRGKRLYHSSAQPELAQAAWISCNTCHVEGEHDGRTWLLQYTGEVPPGAAAVITRNTTSLLGMVETYPLRWSAEWDESADSEFSIRFEQFGTGLIEGPMHPTDDPTRPNQGRSYDLDCLALYIDSLSVSPRVEALTEAGQRGKALFESPETGCSVCHPAPLYTDLQVHDVGTADAAGEWFGPEIDTPSLRFLYDSAPYLHDGSAMTLYDVLTIANPSDQHGVTSHLSDGDLTDLLEYLLSLPHE